MSLVRKASLFDNVSWQHALLLRLLGPLVTIHWILPVANNLLSLGTEILLMEIQGRTVDLLQMTLQGMDLLRTTLQGMDLLGTDLLETAQVVVVEGEIQTAVEVVLAEMPISIWRRLDLTLLGKRFWFIRV